ncbi:MAG: hypothetical protein LQ349_000162 [Xanthoria aureola]|nr:MAG: hypothetical protein LQ349_000162 [Xanthoria aureola]
MLTESFIASIRTVERKAQATATKDIGIHLHDLQPIPSLKTSFKKSTTQPNCLAVSATHIFAAQADKSVIHVYNRDRGNQEAVVPFPENITCLALAGPYHGAGTLVLGTQGGRLILWELATGRQISTAQSHLQSVTCLAVDPTFNFILSGSSDSNLQLWSLPSLLSFSQPSQNDPGQPLPLSPLKTLTNHRAAINALLFAHIPGQTSFAVSAANDQTCVVWDYVNGTVLHTYLFSDNPICLALDPADRAAYTGFADGSIQFINFYKPNNLLHGTVDPSQQATPTQPPPSDRWHLPDSLSAAVYSLQVSYDSTTLLSGHGDGKVHTWNIAKGLYSAQLADFTLPVTNLLMLPPTGFPTGQTPNLKLHNVVKPRYESSHDMDTSSNGDSTIPINYNFTAQLLSTLPLLDPCPGASDLDTALTHPSFPDSMLEEGMAELEAMNDRSSGPLGADDHNEADTLRTENQHLKAQLDDALRRQREAIAEVLEYDKQSLRRKEEESVKRARKKRRRIRKMEMEERRRKVVMGEIVEMEKGDGAQGADEEMDDDLSSDTDELSSD